MAMVSKCWFWFSIVFVLTLTWFLAIMQPYGLRFRSYVMGYYHPDVARTRAVWLHNQVILRRINYVKFARRFLRRKFGLGGGDDTVDSSFLDFIYSKSVFKLHSCTTRSKTKLLNRQRALHNLFIVSLSQFAITGWFGGLSTLKITYKNIGHFNETCCPHRFEIKKCAAPHIKNSNWGHCYHSS